MDRDSFWRRPSDSPKIVPDVQSLLSSLDSLSEMIVGSAHCTVFLFYKTIADWPNFCKRQTGSHNFTP